MHTNRTLLNVLKKDSTIKRNISTGNVDITNEIASFLPIMQKHLEQSNIEKTSNWMLFKDLWLQNETGHLKSSIKYRNYTRGSIIMSIEWGTGNIGTEIRYPHPGVVLYDQGEDWVIAAPITAVKIDKTTKKPTPHLPFEVLALKQNKKPTDPYEYWFSKHSVIQVDQIQRISKYRALNKNSYKLKNNLLNQIDNIILKHYIPGKNQLMENLKELLIEKNTELDNAYKTIEKLTTELEELKIQQK
ncbi:TPA: type II toxin-antitoxin system PemK/MazF family toxin [Bacillus cereus]|nr:type II toxin-antitoxin system PemK/MazF family toxin [Bacillus cereus]